MEIGQEFDFVIFGEHPAGLWAAKHLLGQGRRVLVIPFGVDSGANVLPKAVAKSFKIPEREWANRETNPIQVISGGRRVRVYPDLSSFLEELHFNYGKRLSPGETPPRELLRGLAYLVRGSETGPVLPDDWGAITGRLFETIYFEKEKNWVNQFMLDSLRKEGAVIAPPKSLKQIFIDRKSLVGVQLTSSPKVMSVRTGFINTHFDFVNQFINEPLAIKSAPIAWNFEMRFECGIEFLPKGLTNRLIYVQANSPILDITQESLGKFRMQTTFPLTQQSLDRGEQRRLAERMLRVAETLLPDLEYDLKKLTPDLRDSERATTVELPALFPFQELKRIPPNLLVYAAASALGFQTPIHGLFLTQLESNPKQGLWGAYQAVIQAFDILGRKELNSGLAKISLN
jgi:hypothetical protein